MNVGNEVRFAALKTGAAENVGVALEPVKLPKTVFAAAVERAKDSAGVLVDVATEVVNSGDRFPEETLVTVPVPAV